MNGEDALDGPAQPWRYAGPFPDFMTPSAARIYDAWLGGKDNYRIDRSIAEQVAKIAPVVVTAARANRAFLRRAVAHLSRAGIDQFLDLGAGLPGPGNVHEVAQSINPQTRVVYLDHDPVVLRHALALLACDKNVIAVDGDLRDPQAILADHRILEHLDFTRPIGLLMIAVLHFITEPQAPARIISAFRDVVAPGSALVVSHVVDPGDEPQDDAARDHHRAPATREAAALYAKLAGAFTARAPDEIEALLDGWRLQPPGVVPANQWRPDHRRGVTPVPILVGVGRLAD
jgi:SAM-dependent methyltransferase